MPASLLPAQRHVPLAFRQVRFSRRRSGLPRRLPAASEPWKRSFSGENDVDATGNWENGRRRPSPFPRMKLTLDSTPARGSSAAVRQPTTAAAPSSTASSSRGTAVSTNLLSRLEGVRAESESQVLQPISSSRSARPCRRRPQAPRRSSSSWPVQGLPRRRRQRQRPRCPVGPLLILLPIPSGRPPCPLHPLA